MKKIILIFISIFAFASCNNESRSTEEDIIKAGRIYYFKDLVTGLCYAEINQQGSNAYSFTCVPCDSIAKIKKNRLKIEQ